MTPDEWFERAPGVPMSKSFARAVVISLLSPLDGASVLEVGSGTGAMTVELARAVGAAGLVTGVEESPEAAELTGRNVARAGLSSRVALCGGRAPEAIPDGLYSAAFIGGHGDSTEGIIRSAYEKLAPGGRILLTSVTVGAAARALSILEGVGAEAGVWRACPSSGRRIGADWLMSGGNPIDFIWGDK
jgi:precorrin-6Y C5,15-methyltransferase (decarboxylating) CbiT subunit